MVWSINVHDDEKPYGHPEDVCSYDAPWEAAYILSLKYPQHTISIEGNARYRARLLNGDIIWEEKDLGKFYIEEETASWLIDAIVFAEMLAHEEWMSYADAEIPVHWQFSIEELKCRYLRSRGK